MACHNANMIVPKGENNMVKLNERKIIKRRYAIGVTIVVEGYFINTGIWADGHLAYSRVDDKGNIIEEGDYYQLRALTGTGYHLVMFHV